jgi:putative ABC transport system ATP-binding protein
MIEIENLSYTYPHGGTLRFPDFSLARGQKLLLLGNSGSGKTTLLHLMGGLLRGYAGSLRIEGRELKTLTEVQMDRLRGQKIGYIFQKNHLIHALTVEENIRLSAYLAGLPEDRDRVRQVMEHLGLSEHRNSRITRVSQGQAQRVAIARAVINRPVVILADEPTSALDDVNCERVIQLLVQVAREEEAALFIATHDQRLKQVISQYIELS